MRYEDFDEVRTMNEPSSLPFFRMAENLRTTLALGITTGAGRDGSRPGTLEIGKRADVVVVDGDPFEFAKLKERIVEVWKDGMRVVPFAQVTASTG